MTGGRTIQFDQERDQIVALVWEGLLLRRCGCAGAWREPDQGIWQVRGQPSTSPRPRRRAGSRPPAAPTWPTNAATATAPKGLAGADKIKAEILDKGLSSRGVFRQHYKTDDLDASLLLLPIMGSAPDDKRIKATVLAIADELTQDGLVLRYRVEGTDTGFSGEEGTFTICSFWLVSALAMIGETGRARALCQKLLSFAGPLLLYAEEIDATTGQHLGNFPQAFTHLALIEAVSLLIESELQGHTARA